MISYVKAFADDLDVGDYYIRAESRQLLPPDVIIKDMSKEMAILLEKYEKVILEKIENDDYEDFGDCYFYKIAGYDGIYKLIKKPEIIPDLYVPIIVLKMSGQYPPWYVKKKKGVK